MVTKHIGRIANWIFILVYISNFRLLVLSSSLVALKLTKGCELLAPEYYTQTLGGFAVALLHLPLYDQEHGVGRHAGVGGVYGGFGGPRSRPEEPDHRLRRTLQRTMNLLTVLDCTRLFRGFGNKGLKPCRCVLYFLVFRLGGTPGIAGACTQHDPLIFGEGVFLA